MTDARALLERLDEHLSSAGGERDAYAPLAYVAATGIAIDDDLLRAARRRAVLLLAAGGDPHRDLEPDGRAVRRLADDLDAPERRRELLAALTDLRAIAEGLDAVADALDRLLADPELAWRSLACALLADEVAGEAE